jgi:predicted NBD/HSP70 family sugar kinase
MADEVKKMRAGDTTAQATWEIIQEYFQSAIRTVYAEYSCRTIIIGGRGVDDLDYYLGNWQPPCPVVPAKLGEQAGLYGAIRIGLDIYDEENKEWDEK